MRQPYSLPEENEMVVCVDDRQVDLTEGKLYEVLAVGKTIAGNYYIAIEDDKTFVKHDLLRFERLPKSGDVLAVEERRA
jgi:hypothetical protein